MIQYDRGVFGDIESADKTMKELVDMFNVDQMPMAVHFGTREALENIKKEATIEEKMKALEDRVRELEPIKTERIIPASAQDVINFGNIQE